MQTLQIPSDCQERIVPIAACILQAIRNLERQEIGRARESLSAALNWCSEEKYKEWRQRLETNWNAIEGQSSLAKKR